MPKKKKKKEKKGKEVVMPIVLATGGTDQEDGK
jgi:hypothetical protein